MFQASTNRAQVMASSADRDGMATAIETAATLSDRIGQPYMKWQVLYLRCLFVLLSGDAREAERLADEALKIGLDSGQPDAFVIYGANLINIRFHQDRLEEILPVIEQAAADNPGLPSFRAAHAMALCECGRFDEAKPLLRAASEADFHPLAYDYVWLTTTTLWAETAAWLEDVQAADQLYGRLSAFAGQGVSSGASFSGTVDMYLGRLAGVLGRCDDAMDHVERADAQLLAVGAPFWRARNQLEWARLLTARGRYADHDQAGALLEGVRRTAASYGCAGIERRAAALADG